MFQHYILRPLKAWFLERKPPLKVGKTHYWGASPSRKEQYIGLNVSVGHRSLVVLTLLKNSQLGLFRIDACGSAEQLLVRPNSVSHTERTVSPINLTIWRSPDLCQLYLHLEFQHHCHYGSQNAESAKVDFDKVLSDSASTVASITIRRNNIWQNGWRCFAKKCLLYKIHINRADSEDLDWAA
jgi:hypothetical protein